jgi:hypothetical protein
MSFFSFFLYKIGKQEGKTGTAWVCGVGTSGKGEVVWKGHRRVNAHTVYTRCKCKIDDC